MEWAGAFGDLGTLIPFIVAYLATLKLDPVSVLFSFGLAMVVCGLVYCTPFPVQPMKAIGAVATTQAAQTFTVTAGAIYASSWVTGVVWLLMGLTGMADKLTNIVSRSATRLQHLMQRLLDQPIHHRRDAQRAHPTLRLGNVPTFPLMSAGYTS